MLISKHFDPVMGIDIHFLIIPPAGPVPIPHPHIALVFDPFDYVPFIGATVKVGGLPRSTAGTAGKPIPHIPMGGPFAKPPMNENEIFMGSVTVLADGGPLSYTAVPSLSCHDIGLIAPPRKKKPKKSFGMVLPTSVVLSIPLGMPVMVGGAPTIDMMGLAMMGGFAALGGAFKKLRKMQKKSPRMKKISSAIHNRAKKAMDKLGVPPNIRNKVHKNICTVTGHPVDVATGKMFTDHVDFSLPGPLPLVWERTWYSTSVYDGPLGHGWHHSYDLELCEMDNAVAVRLADGRSVAFPVLHINEKSFDRQERMTLLRDAEGYALDTKDKQRYRFTPFQGQAEKQLLTSLSQTTSGASIYFYYNEQAQLQQITDSGGRLIQFSHTDDGRIHKIFLPEPESNLTRDHTQHKSFCAVEHHYRNGMLVQVDDALQQPLQYHYDNTLLIKETFRSGLSFYFEYDGLDHNARCLRTWGDGGIYYRDIRYDTVNNITYVKNSHGYVTTYYHNGVLPHRVVDPLNHASSTEYNEYSEIVCETNELGFKTRYEFDEKGNTVKILHPDNHSIQFVFDEQGNLVELINKIGSSWSYKYDANNRLASKQNPLGHITQYEYNDTVLSNLIDTAGNKISFSYDQNLNLRSVIESSKVQISLEYDAIGNLLVSKDPLGNYRRHTYDKLSRLRKIEEPDGNVRLFSYDTGGNLVHAKDAQYDISLEYIGMGCLASRTQGGATVKFEYDTEEQLISIINEQQKIYRFERNANGEIISETGYGGDTRHFIKDPAGRILRINRPDQHYSLFNYNATNQIIKVSHSDGSYKAFEYRADGELIKAINDSTCLCWEIDPLGRTIKESQGEAWVASEYDSLGFRVLLKSSLGFSQSVERNSRGAPTKISANGTAFETTIERNDAGQEIERDLPGGIKSRWIRDRLGRPIRHEVWNQEHSLQNKTYIWGLSDRLLKLITAENRETIFQHDPLGNLISARYNDGTFDLRIPNSVGSLFKTHAMNDREYGAAGQLLKTHSQQGDIQFQYDAEGNLISKLEPDNKLWRYEWNCSNLLVRVIRPDSSEVKFEYDALGRRIKKIVNEKITHWIWDENNPLHEWVEHKDIKHLAEDLFVERSKDEPVTWVFDPESFTPLAKLVGNESYSIISDHLGTPNFIFDSHGKNIWSAEIDIWGNLRKIDGEKNFCPFRFPGQYEDSETGLYYNRFRYYDPAAGQYISQDPIRLAGSSFNLYSYVQDPNAYADLLGLAWNPQGPGLIGNPNYPDVVASNNPNLTPDFSSSTHLYQAKEGQQSIVKIKLQGSRSRDFVVAFKAAGIKKSEASGYTWHHFDDFDPITGESTMQLVKRSAHEGTYVHKGSADQFAKAFGVDYDSHCATKVAQDKGWIAGRKPKDTCPSCEAA